MTDPDLESKHTRNREFRREEIRRWAEYVRTNPDEDWGAQVNTLIDSQLASARHHEHDRPDIDELRESALLDE